MTENLLDIELPDKDVLESAISALPCVSEASAGHRSGRYYCSTLRALPNSIHLAYDARNAGDFDIYMTDSGTVYES